METQRILLVAAAVVELALWLVIAGRYKTPHAPDGAVVLRYGRKLRMLGLCIAFAVPILTIVLFAAPPPLSRTRPIGNRVGVRGVGVTANRTIVRIGTANAMHRPSMRSFLP